MPLAPDQVASYGDLSDKLAQLKQTNPDYYGNMTLHEYSTRLNEQTGTQNFNAGLDDNFVKRASHSVDQALDATGVTDLSGDVGKALGGLISPAAGEWAEQMGRSLPRQALATGIGAGIGSLVGPEGTVAGGLEGLEAEGGLTGAAALANIARAKFIERAGSLGYGANQGVQTYTDTGSPAAGVAAGTLGYLTQGFGKVGSDLAASQIGARIVAKTEGAVPSVSAKYATEAFGLGTGLILNNELTRQAVNIATGQGVTMPSTADAVSDVAGGLVPAGFHVGLGALSMGDSVRLVNAAQDVRIKEIRDQVQQAAVAADTTLTKTTQADNQRASAVDKILNPADALAYHSLMEGETTPPAGTVPDKTQTVLGKPLQSYGSPQEPLGEPTTPPEGTVPAQGAQPVQANKLAPTGEAAKPAVSANEATPLQQQAESEQAIKVAQLPPTVKAVVAQTPKPITLESLVAKVKFLNDCQTVPSKLHATWDNITELIESSLEHSKQLADEPGLRERFGLPLITDQSLFDDVTRLMSKDGGSMSGTKALERVYQSRINELKTSSETVQAHLEERNKQLAAENVKKLAEHEAAQAQAVGTTLPPKQQAAERELVRASEFVTRELRPDRPHSQEIQDALAEGHVVANPMVGIEHWVRYTRLNGDAEARLVLKETRALIQQKGGRLTADEFQQIIDRHPSLSEDAISDLQEFYGRSKVSWTLDGNISETGPLANLLSDNPHEPEIGSWTTSLSHYLRSTAASEARARKGQTSFNKPLGEDGENTLGDVYLQHDAEAAAAEKHEDEEAKKVSVARTLERLEQTRLIRERFANMTNGFYMVDGVGKKNGPNEVTALFRALGMTPPEKERLQDWPAMMQHYIEGVCLSLREQEVGDKKATLANWLFYGPADAPGSHAAWRRRNLTAAAEGDKASNIGGEIKVCAELYRKFAPLDKNGVPQIDPRFADPNWYKEQPKEGAKATGQEAQPPVKQPAVTQSEKDFQVALDMHSWFTGSLKQLGLREDSPMFGRYRDSMVRVALLFPQIDKTRIAGLVSPTGKPLPAGSALRMGPDDSSVFTKMINVVALAYNYLSSTAGTVFMKNVTGAHEYHHVLVQARLAGVLGPELNALWDKNAEWARTGIDEDDRRKLLMESGALVLPKGIVNSNRPEHREIVSAFNKMIEYGVRGGDKDEYDPEEFLATLYSLHSIGAANPAPHFEGVNSVRELWKLLPDTLFHFNRAYYTDLLYYSKAIEGYFNETNPALGKSYGDVTALYKELVRSQPQINAALKSVNELMSNSPENYPHLTDIEYERVSPTQALFGFKGEYGLKDVHDGPMLAGAREALFPDPKLAPIYGHNPGFWSLFTPLAQFAERYPVMRPLADTLLSFQGYVNAANMQALSPFATMTKGGKIIKTENMDAVSAAKNSPITGPVINSLLLWQNAHEESVGPGNIAKLAPNLSPKQQEDVLHTLSCIQTSLQTSGASTINLSTHVSGHMLGALAVNMERAHGMTSKTGEQIGLNMMKAMIGLTSKDPGTVQMSQELLRGSMAQMEPETGVTVLKLAKEFADKMTREADPATGQKPGLIPMMTNRPWWSPETRPGEFGMYYEKDGKPGFTSFKTQHEAVAARDKYNTMANVKGVRLINPFKNQAPGAQYSEAAVMHFVDLEQTAYKAAQAAFANDPDGQAKLAEFAQLYSPGTEILKELGSQGMRKNMQERKLVQGREDIDMVSNALNYVTSMSRANAKSYIRSKTMLQHQDPTLANEPRLRDMFNDHMNAVLDPPPSSPVWSWLKRTVISYYIGGNFSSAASMALQPIQATLPHLTRNGVGIVQGMKYFVGANKILVNAFARGKGIIGDPVLNTAVQKALTDRVIGFSDVLSQFDHNDDALVSRIQNFANDTPGSNNTGAKLLQNVSYQTSRILGYMSTHTIDHNTRVGFIAGFNAFRDIGKQRGLVGQDLADYAYSEAKRTVEATLHTGGAASRPMGFGKVGGLYGLTSAMYALNHFNFSMIAIMGRYGMEALGRTGLEGAALHNARKAFGQAMVTQLALSGAMGLPFAGAAVALLEELFPNLQLNRDMRTAISSLAGDDHALGGFLADASLKGLATAMSPVDVSGRLGLSAVLGNDPYYGFEASDVLGAPGSMLLNMAKGVQHIATGDPSGVTKFLPNALQRMYAAASDGGAVKNAEGQVVFQPTDAQRVLSAIGLRPKDESHAQEEQMMDERNQTIQSRELARWYTQQESLLQSGDFAGVKAALYQKAQEDSTFSPIIALKRIVAGAQKSQVVQSPTDKGSASQLRAREQVGQTFGQPTMSQQQPSQVRQVLERAELERQVGLPGAGHLSQTELSTARLMDYLMQHYNLDDGQARALVSQMREERQPGYRQFHPGAVSPLAALQASGGQTQQQ